MTRGGSDAVTADDLTAIRGIDRSVAAELLNMGVVRYAQIAQWDSSQVRLVSNQLALGRRLSQQNWIEQAALLALQAGSALPGLDQSEQQSPVSETRPALEPEPLGSQPASEQTVSPEDISTAEQSAHSAPLFGLEDIRGMTETFSSKLATGGITKPLQIAQWTAGDVAWWSSVLGAAAQIEKDNWIAQAAILAMGLPTHYAAQRHVELNCGSDGQTELATAPSSDGGHRLRTLRIERRFPATGGKPILRVRVMPRSVSAKGTDRIGESTAPHGDDQVQTLQMSSDTLLTGPGRMQSPFDLPSDGTAIELSKDAILSEVGVSRRFRVTECPLSNESGDASLSRSRFDRSSEYFFGAFPTEAAVEIVRRGADHTMSENCPAQNSIIDNDQFQSRGVARFLKLLLGG